MVHLQERLQKASQFLKMVAISHMQITFSLCRPFVLVQGTMMSSKPHINLQWLQNLHFNPKPWHGPRESSMVLQILKARSYHLDCKEMYSELELTIHYFYQMPMDPLRYFYNQYLQSNKSPILIISLFKKHLAEIISD